MLRCSEALVSQSSPAVGVGRWLHEIKGKQRMCMFTFVRASVRSCVRACSGGRPFNAERGELKRWVGPGAVGGLYACGWFVRELVRGWLVRSWP